MRIAIAVLLVMHAIAHLPGFLVSWRLIEESAGLPYRTTILAGKVNVGASGIRVIGILWLFAGLLVAMAAISLLRNTNQAWSLAWVAVTFSTLMSVLGWPDSRAGAVLNAAAIAFLSWVWLRS